MANSVDYEDEDEAEFIAEADAYEKHEIIAYNSICWPDYISTEVRIEIFYEYLKLNPLITNNEGFTIIKKRINKLNDIEIIFSLHKNNNNITLPSTKDLGFINKC